MPKDEIAGGPVDSDNIRKEVMCRDLVEHAPEIIARVDPTFRHTFVNPAAETLLGIPPTRFLGKTVAELDLPENLRAEWETHLKDVFEDHRQVHFEFNVESNSGMHWFQADLVPEFSDSQTVGSVLEIIREDTRHHELERQLHEKEEQLTLLINRNQEYAMIMLDLSGRILSWNLGAELILAHRPMEVLKGNYSSLFSEEDIRWNKPEQELLFARNKGRNQSKLWLRRKDGSLFWAEMVITLLKNDQGVMKGFSLVIRDLTEQRKYEEEIRYQRALLEALSETSPDGILVSTEQKILYYNHRFLEMWKFPDGIIQSRSDELALQWAISHILDPEAFNQRVAQAYKNPDIQVHDEIALTDGRTFEHYSLPVHGYTGHYYGRVWFFRDITGSKVALKALQESEERFRILAECSPIAIFKTDAEGNCNYVNPIWEKVTGLTNGDSSGDGWTKAVYSQDFDEVLKSWKKTLHQKEQWHCEFRLLAQDGKPRWVRVLSNCIMSPSSEVIGHVATIEDISERKETEALLRQAKDSLENYTRELEARVQERTAELKRSLHTIENCLYSVAHDFKAPLRAIDGFTTTLLEDYAPHFDERGRELANEVVKAAERMDALISAYLEYGKLTYIDVPCSSVDIEPCINAAANHLESHDCSARITISRPLHRVLGNQGLLTDIFVQIIANSVKFATPGVPPAVNVWTERSGASVWINVQDNGIGIAPEFHDVIFGIFNRLHGKEIPGTGIGLAIVEKAAERMNGKVGVKSLPGKGTTLWLELPTVE
jgi:PAS domain S-box-containing protein